MNEFVSHIDVVDAHQHFWDLSANRYPWLQDEEPIAFRYGDYSPLRRNYLPVDYRRDTAGCGIVHTVHVEAERDRAVPHAETRWLGRLATAEGLPTVLVAHARLDAPDAAEVLSAHAACPMVRGIRHKPAAAKSHTDARRGAAGSMDDPAWRRGVGPDSISPSTCRRHGGTWTPRSTWRATFQLPRSSSTTRPCPPTAVRKDSPHGDRR